MNSPRWWSQPFPPTGAITSEGIRNQLGRPPIDPLTVFVRETAQNSWDARLPNREVDYRLEISHVSAAFRPVWQRMLTPPAVVDRHLPLGRVLRGSDLRLLTVADRGTAGLGGPTRADELSKDRRDWVSFVLNVGAKRDTEYGGGTYGYGKAVLYRLSRVGTILVYTRTGGGNGRLETRLIGVAMGKSYGTDNHRDPRPYTGRHWWGLVHDEHVEPLVGAAADEMAGSLGLPQFRTDETGTSLVVVDPDLSDFDDAEAGGDTSAATHLAETIAWHTWPIMLTDRGRERLRPAVTVNGAQVPVPDPERTYPLDKFVAAYRQAKAPEGATLACRSPRRDLGRFALIRDVVLPMTEDGTAAAAYAGVPRDPHHVCLMRSPELVVSYLPGPEPYSSNLVYAGVFRALDALDDVYAASEPPTHDNWVHEQLTGNDRRFVSTTFKRIREELAHFKRPDTTASVQTEVPLGAASSFLGDLIAAAFDTTTSPAAGQPEPRKAGGGGGGVGPAGGGGEGDRLPAPAGSRVRVTPTEEPRIDELRDGLVVVQPVQVHGSDLIELSATLHVGLSEGREDEPPAGAAVPTIHSWRTSSGIVIYDAHCTVQAPAEIELRVRYVTDTLTEIAVTGRVIDLEAS